MKNKKEIDLGNGYLLTLSDGRFGRGFTLWGTSKRHGQTWFIDASCFSEDFEIAIAPDSPSIKEMIKEKWPTRLRIKCRATGRATSRITKRQRNRK